MPLINYHSVLTLKSMLSVILLYFEFFLKEILTLLTRLVKTSHCNTENDIGKFIPDSVKRTCRIFSSFIFQPFSVFMNDNIEYLQVLAVERRFCQLQINSPVMASLYIFKLKINAKLQKKRLLGGETCQSTMYLP